jgi:phytoene dehydrogenase-like protein
MADATYDAIIIGGGTKVLFTAMYLAKYGGMKVGIFERRHELGGGLACSEGPGGGFVADTHASTIYEWYYRPVMEDFPDFEEKGCRFGYHPMTLSVITKEDQQSVGIYQHRVDPNGEKTAQLLSQYSQRDADTFLKLFRMCKPGGEFDQAFVETFFSPPPPPDQPDPMERWAQGYIKRPDALIDYTWTQLAANRAVQELWDNLALQLMTIRRLKAVGTITEVSSAMSLLSMVVGGTSMCYIQGGTHNVPHACQRILLENGADFVTKKHVDKILIENGRAKGIRLADGTEIAARHVVVSGVDPRQLAFKLIGPDHISQRVLRRVNSLEDTLTCITWYTWALHELPSYEAAAQVNPGVNEAQWVMLATKDMDRMINEAYERRLGKTPDVEGMLVVVGHHSRTDETRAPAGKHTCLTEQHVLPAWALTEREWMAFKKQHAQDIMREWQQYAPNMSWDNVIGCDALTPYDTAGRLLNLSPTGNQAVVDALPGQGGKVRPIAEFSRYRTPIQGLYATGSAWGLFHSGSAGQGYACYKAIAEDMNLGKPWAEKGRSY